MGSHDSWLWWAFCKRTQQTLWSLLSQEKTFKKKKTLQSDGRKDSAMQRVARSVFQAKEMACDLCRVQGEKLTRGWTQARHAQKWGSVWPEATWKESRVERFPDFIFQDSHGLLWHLGTPCSEWQREHPQLPATRQAAVLSKSRTTEPPPPYKGER